MKNYLLILVLSVASLRIHAQSDTLKFTRAMAEQKAKQHGCYHDNPDWHNKVYYDVLKNSWRVISYKTYSPQWWRSRSKKSRFEFKIHSIEIDAATGKILHHTRVRSGAMPDM
ncbi:MAG TPA: hypothetical protein VL651_01665 [Bacteroidia bacterium]|jgi:hypothetical protein|nr:hypothetical protein [Bacteroidia bacterium]